MLSYVRYVLAFIHILAIAGCQGGLGNIAAKPDSTVELLESELRWMEDNLYRMDDQLNGCLDQLESAKRNNAILRLELAEAQNKIGATSPVRSGSKPSGGAGNAKFDEDNELTDDEILDLTPPNIRLGPSEKTKKSADQSDSVEKSSELFENDEIKVEGLPDPESIRPQLDPSKPSEDPPTDPFKSDDIADPDEVTRILLNRRLTGAYDFDGESGHDGIMVVVEPQNAYAQFVPAPGNITVEVRDPSQAGITGRVGKWKFDASEAQSQIKKTLMGEGIHLQLPWPGAPPQNEQLSLSVAYQTPDGRTLQSEKKIRINPVTSALVSKAIQAEHTVWTPNRPTATAARPVPDRQPNR